ncbi:MAG TPA: hypothetical protein VFF64_13540 [Candidatus Eremiobacteraceae bacterium]|nr:hypothetical protein [Candidatus Eremiobacteraceae bacterium]
MNTGSTTGSWVGFSPIYDSSQAIVYAGPGASTSSTGFSWSANQTLVVEFFGTTGSSATGALFIVELID